MFYRFVKENGSKVTETVTFWDLGYAKELVLDFDISEPVYQGTAEKGVDYSISYSEVEDGYSITFTPLDDDIYEGTEYVDISVSGWIEFAGPGPNPEFYTNIYDDLVRGVKTREEIEGTVRVYIRDDEIDEEGQPPTIQDAVVSVSTSDGGASFYASGAVTGEDPDGGTVAFYLQDSKGYNISVNLDGSFSFEHFGCLVGDSTSNPDLEFPVRVVDDEGDEALGSIFIHLPSPSDSQGEIDRIQAEIAEGQSDLAEFWRIIEYLIEGNAQLQNVRFAQEVAASLAVGQVLKALITSQLSAVGQALVNAYELIGSSPDNAAEALSAYSNANELWGHLLALVESGDWNAVPQAWKQMTDALGALNTIVDVGSGLTESTRFRDQYNRMSDLQDQQETRAAEIIEKYTGEVPYTLKGGANIIREAIQQLQDELAVYQNCSSASAGQSVTEQLASAPPDVAEAVWASIPDPYADYFDFG